jgi:hypothetical protein
MSHLVFQTNEGYPDRVEIAGVGVLGARGKGAVPVAHAADLMVELQGVEIDTAGRQVRVPLTGAALRKAAEIWASRIAGVEVVEASDERLAQLPLELGSAPEHSEAIPHPLEAATLSFQSLYGPHQPTVDERVAVGATTVAEAEQLSGIPPEQRTLAVWDDIKGLTNEQLEEHLRSANVEGRSKLKSAEEKREALAKHLNIETGGAA